MKSYILLASTYPSSMGAKSYSRESLTSDSEDNYPAPPPQGVPGGIYT